MTNKSTSKRTIQQTLFAYSLMLIMSLLISAPAISPLWAAETDTEQSDFDITVYKTASCGCCSKWVEHLQADGFVVKVETVEETSTINAALGLPPQLVSCHTAVVGDYWVEGHVPADLVRKLILEKPADIKGISVPGMPPGSPGMESPHPVTYEILSVNNAGQVAVYATREGKSEGKSQP